MKKTILSLAFILGFTLLSEAQEFKGTVVYEAKIDMSDFKNRMQGNRQMSPDQEKAMEERVKKMSESTHILNFDKNASVYKEEEKLDAPGQTQSRFGFNMMGGFGKNFYKNIKTKTYAVDKEFLGKEFLIKDSLTHIDWKITGETRKIGDYNCFKATAVRPASKSDMRSFRFKKEEKKDEKSTATTEKSTNIMDQFEVAKEVNITAWFTPQIPVGQGPENYWGLPGLILEVNDGKTTILCSKLVLNSKDKTEIKAPTHGQEVSQKEFDEIVAKKMAEMSQMNQGRGNGNGNRMPH